MEYSKKKILDYILIIMIGIFPFLPATRSIDKIYPQIFYLSAVCFISFVVLFSTKRFKGLLKTFSSNEIIAFIVFLLFSLTSIFYAFNVQEAIIALSKYFLFFNLLLICYTLFSGKKKFLISFIIFFGVIETLKIFYVFVDNFSWSYGLNRIRELQGFSSNMNIGAFSLAIKTPIFLFVFYKLKKGFLKNLIFSILSLMLFCILVMGTRGAILALLILFVCIIGYMILTKDKKLFRGLLPIFIGFSFVIICQSYLYKSNSELQVINRATSYDDSSVSGRIDYYKACFDKITENPFVGVGIGNWKILSLKYGSDSIKFYKVPVHAHNDFLHLASEVGVLGSFIYLLIFILPVYVILKNKNRNLLDIFLVFSIMIFLIDSNLNFPRARPYSFINIIYVLTLFHLNKNSKGDEII